MIFLGRCYGSECHTQIQKEVCDHTAIQTNLIVLLTVCMCIGVQITAPPQPQPAKHNNEIKITLCTPFINV